LRLAETPSDSRIFSFATTAIPTPMTRSEPSSLRPRRRDLVGGSTRCAAFSIDSMSSLAASRVFVANSLAALPVSSAKPLSASPD
jgi:hypothetical protein